MKIRKTILAACVAACFITACQSEDVKVIEKETEASAEVQENTDNNSVDTNTQNTQKEEDNTQEKSGFYYLAEGPKGTMDITADMDMSDVLSTIGDENTYFEAASCAFEGLDKVYTYDHFEIDTYPDGDVDKISAIVLLDDLSTTKEGVYIGQTKADMESVYGTDYENNSNSYVYTKEDVHLEFILEGDTIISISINSSVLDEAQN
ncbi:MAG: hypothetical protein K6A23_15510 [Butyrivibrio sp.]|nr:hypothetical protein [Butyrivibrio sp.]